MSQTADHDREKPSDAFKKARLDQSLMLLQGRSFSGNERNCCFINTGSGRFANISATSGLDFPDDGRGVALVDWDHDGDLDVWISNRNAPRLRFLRNETRGEKHFLEVRLEGDGMTTNSDAIGARVEIVLRDAGAKKLVKTLRAGEGYLAQSSKWIHFGLGDAKFIEKLIVRWPTGDPVGAVEEFTSLEVDSRYQLVQGSGRARRLPLNDRSLRLAPSQPDLPPQSAQARIPLVTLLPMPKLTYKGLDGRDRLLPVGEGKPVLLNLWASWCGPCVAELKELTSRQREIRAAGIEIIALSIDGLGDVRSSPADAARLLSALKFEFLGGMATTGLIEMVQNLNNGMMRRHRPLQIPTSFLIDRQGRLAVIYRGPVSVDDLLNDVTHSQGTRIERWIRSSPLTGRAVEHDQVKLSAKTAETRLRLQVAGALQEIGRLDDALIHYLDVVKIGPDLAWVRNKIGNLFTGKGNWPEAITQYERALRIQPDNAEAHNNLGDLFARQGDWPRAVVQYEQALRIQPDRVGAHNDLGNALANQGNLDRAQAEFEHAIRLQPEFAMAHKNLGSVLARGGNWRQAVFQFERALRIQPDYAEASEHLKRVRALLSRDN